jgi:hypothetical protein
MAIQTVLTRAGYSVWMDLTSMGSKIQTSMKEGIANSRMAVVLVCKEYMERLNCKTEWETIVSTGKPFIVVNVAGSGHPTIWCTPDRTLYQQILEPALGTMIDCGHAAGLRAGPDNGPSDEMYETIHRRGCMPALLQAVGGMLVPKQ